MPVWLYAKDLKHVFPLYSIQVASIPTFFLIVYCCHLAFFVFNSFRAGPESSLWFYTKAFLSPFLNSICLPNFLINLTTDYLDTKIYNLATIIAFSMKRS